MRPSLKSNKRHLTLCGIRLKERFSLGLHHHHGGCSSQILLTSFVLLWGVVSSRAQPGALDPDFYRYSVFDGVVYALTTQPDGKVLVGGAFTSVTGVSRKGIARVNTSGNLDATFNPGIGVEGNDAGVYAMASYTNGT